MEQSGFPKMPPESLETRLFGQFALLHEIRAQHVLRLTESGIIDKARKSVLPGVESLFENGQIAAAICVLPSKRIIDRRIVIDPSSHEEGIKLTYSGAPQRNVWLSTSVFCQVAVERNGRLLPRQDKQATFEENDAQIVHSMVQELRDARTHGMLPALSPDLTTIMAYEA